MGVILHIRSRGLRYLWLGLGLLAVLLGGKVQAQNNPVRAIQADDVSNLRVLTLLDGHSAPIAEMSFSPDNTAFITGGLDGQLCVWNIRALGQRPGQLRFCLDSYQAGITRFIWSATAGLLAITTDDSIMIYDSRGTRPQEHLHLELPAPVPILDGGFLWGDTRLWVYDLYGQVFLFDTDSGDVLAEAYAPFLLPVPRQDALLIIGEEAEENSQLAWLDAETGTIEPWPIMAEHAVFSPDGALLFTWGITAEVWETDSLFRRNPRPLFTLDTDPEAGLFSPDNQMLATWAGETISLWRMETGELIETLREHRGGVRYMAFSADSRRAISVSERGTGRYWVINTTTLIPFLDRWLVGEIDGLIFSPDGQSFVATREGFSARFYRWRDGQLRGNFDLTTQAVFSPDWSLIAEARGHLVIWIGLEDDPRIFAWMPLGFATREVNVRPTPSQDLQRIASLSFGQPVFARGRTINGNWVFIQLPDGTQGWIQPDQIQLQGEVRDLSIINPE
jgi:WD40 repeat protein